MGERQVMSGATLSACERYRYHLWRRLGEENRPCLFIMLNPSTADAEKDDPTIRRCMGFARAFGCGMLEVVNLFAFRATDPKKLRIEGDPIGPDNDRYILRAALECQIMGGLIIGGWGRHGEYMGRGLSVAELLRANGISLQSLNSTADGQPSHPLYLRRESSPGPHLFMRANGDQLLPDNRRSPDDIQF